jgi:hypothetical protein
MRKMGGEEEGKTAEGSLGDGTGKGKFLCARF